MPSDVKTRRRISDAKRMRALSGIGNRGGRCGVYWVMKYTVEIACTDADAEVLHRIQIYELNKRRARAKAQMVLGAWRNHGPKCARVLNSRNRQLYCVKWTSRVRLPPNTEIN